VPNTCAAVLGSGFDDQLLAGRQLTTWCASRLPKLGWRSSEMPRDVLTSTGRTWKDTAEGSVLAESSNLQQKRSSICQTGLSDGAGSPHMPGLDAMEACTTCRCMRMPHRLWLRTSRVDMLTSSA
jgi:hypothetical protein